MKRELGIAYCGLACCMCSENVDCPGCRADGWINWESCPNRRDCLDRDLEGCWACRSFPCAGTILDNPRIRAFARYAGAFGQVALLDCLAEGERRGLSYHYPGKLTGDYDSPGTEEDIFALLCALGG